LNVGINLPVYSYIKIIGISNSPLALYGRIVGTNRGQIKEMSIRTAQKMAECFIDGGDSDDWEDEFLENRNAA
jgi:hypothetical protein